MVLSSLQRRGLPPQPQISILLSLRNLAVRNHSGGSNSESIVYLIQLNNSFLHKHQLPLQDLCSRTVNVRSTGWAVGGIGNSYYNSLCSKLHTFHLKTSDNSMTSNLYEPPSMFLSKSSLSCYEANSLFCVKYLDLSCLRMAGESYFNGDAAEWNAWDINTFYCLKSWSGL